MAIEFPRPSAIFKQSQNTIELRLQCTCFIVSTLSQLTEASQASHGHGPRIPKANSNPGAPGEYHVHSASITSSVSVHNGKLHEEVVKEEETVDRQGDREPVTKSEGTKVITDCDGVHCTRKEEPLTPQTPTIKAGGGHRD